jgi:hypothetical protein
MQHSMSRHRITISPARWWTRPTSALAAILLLQARPLHACPVCFSAGRGPVLETYYLTTVLLMLLPLVILGSIAGWLYLRFRESDKGSPGQAIELS